MSRWHLRRAERALPLLSACALWTLALACGAPQTHTEPQPAADTVAVGAAVGAAVEAAAIGESDSVLQVHDVRLHLMPDMGSLYLVVDNSGKQPDRLLSVETALASKAETHETVDEEGVMRMRPRPEGFEVPAAGRLVLEPGGKHVMLMAPSVPAGDTVQVVLHFERAGAVEVTATVSGAPGAAAGDHAMDHESPEPHGGH